MFGFFKKNKIMSNKFKFKKWDIEVISIIKDGKSLFTSTSVDSWDIAKQEGRIIEVGFFPQNGNPYFVYYMCERYWLACNLEYMGAGMSIDGVAEFNGFREGVSLEIFKFLQFFIVNKLGFSLNLENLRFSHNKINTNSLIFVPCLNSWLPVKHKNDEAEDAAFVKVKMFCEKKCHISDLLPIHDLSPYSDFS